MDTPLLTLVVIIAGLLYQNLSKRVRELSQRLKRREDEHQELLLTVERLHQQLLKLQSAPPAPPTSASATAVAPVAAPAPLTAAEWQKAPAAASAAPTPPPVAVAPPAPAPTTPAPAPTPEPSVASTPPAPPVLPAPAAPKLTPPAPAPEQPTSKPQSAPAPVVRPVPAPALLPRPAQRPAPAPVAAMAPAGPTWWDRAEQMLLDNWTGILGAIILVTGIGFLGIYTALRVSAPVRFGMITAFAGALLGLHYYLRPKPFAKQLHVWLQSSAAAVFLFACVGAVSVPGLQWAGPPLSYVLLLAGVAANLWLAWDASRESVATLHGVLSLVALAVLPHTLLTLGGAAGVTAFSIGITYRQRWKYQLLLSILSFFVFHQYWHHAVPSATGSTRLVAMGLVLLVGVAAAVVQYRKVYAQARFDALLFSAHVLNWTCLGINLYHYSTGSPWKTVPLGLGAVLTFWVARQARQLQIQWLFRTDSIISLMLALFTAFSLQGWHASSTLILLFMLLETLLVAFVMAREREMMVFNVASAGAVLAAGALLVLNISLIGSYSASELYRNALLLLLSGLLGACYYQLVRRQPLFEQETGTHGQELYRGFGGLVGGLYMGAAALLLRALFGLPHPAVALLLGSAALAAGALFGVAWWLRSSRGWFRTMHLLAGQVLLMVCLVGLHKAGLGWPATTALLYLETLLLAGRLGQIRENSAYYILLVSALLSGSWFVLSTLERFGLVPPQELHIRMLLLLLTGLASSVLLTLPARLARFTQLLTSDTQPLYVGLQALTVLFYLTGTGLLLQGLFGLGHSAVAPVLAGAVVAAGLLFAVSRWLRGIPGWFRPAHVLLGQLVLMVAVLGLHELGLSWPATSTLLYGEVLAMTLLLAWRAEWLVYRVLLYTALVLAAALPLLVYHPGLLPNAQRAGLLVLAALASLGTQLLLTKRSAPVHDLVPLSYDSLYRIRLLSLLPGVQLLAAGSLVYTHTWASWAAAGLGVSLLLIRRFGKVPGLWLGLVVATVGYQALQWTQVLPVGLNFYPWPVLGYLLPMLALPAIGLFCSWWEGKQQHVRWPWLYLSGLQLLAATWAALAPRTEALPVLAWVLLAAGAALAAQLLRSRFASAAALTRAGSPDRYLLHLTYALLAVAFLGHFGQLASHSTDVLLGWPVRRLTAGALLVVITGWAWQRSPTTAPVYTSWRYLHPLLPEVVLLFGSFTIWHEMKLEWHSALWITAAFTLTLGGQYLPLRLRRVRVYGLLFFGAAVIWSSYVALAMLAPGELFTLAGLTTMATTVGLFAYTAVALQHFPSTTTATWPRLLAPLAALGRLPVSVLIPLLLYPAFGVLTLLLLQSFDNSILTVLLMLEVLAAFISSLLLRRQDLRYLSLAGTALCFGRLLLYDLSQHGTITRAIVFILMGVLLLGMNALYARFKGRFSLPDAEPPAEPDITEDNVADSMS